MPQQRLFVGDSFPILQEALVTGVQTLKTAAPLLPLTILVPHELLAKHLQRTIALVSGGYLGVSISTMGDFAYAEVAERFAEEGQRPLSAVGARLIGRKLLSAAGPRNYFATAASHPGFFRNLLTTLRDLKQARITPQGFATFLERAQLNDSARHRMESLGSLYREYVRFLDEHQLYDSEDLLAQAVEAAAERGDTSPLLLYGYTALTPLQRQVVAAAGASRDTWVFLPWREGPAYERVTPLLGWLISLGFQRTTVQGETTPRTNLSRLQTRLFESVYAWQDEEASSPDASVSVIAAPNTSREAREVGRTILTLVREQHLHFDEIAVLLPTPASSAPLFGETLAQLGIPYSFAKGVSLQQTPAGQSVLLLCQLLAEEYPRARMFEFLGSAQPPFSELLGDDTAYARLARWEVIAREARILRGAEEWRTRLSQFIRQCDSAPEEEEPGTSTNSEDCAIVRAFARFLEQFLADTSGLPQRDTWYGWAGHFLKLLATYVTPTTYTDRVTETLQRLAQLAVLDEPVSLSEWSRVVEEAFAETFVPSLPRGATAGVMIGDISSARGLQFRAVIIPGMNEGQFPQTLRQDPLLLDVERQYLSEILLVDLAQRSQIREEERLTLMLATQMASATLVVSYARHDSFGGHSLMPSSYLLRVVEVLSQRPASLSDLRDWCQQLPFSPLPAGPPTRALDVLEFHYASVEQTHERGELTSLGYLPTVTPFFSRALTALHQRWDVTRLTPFDGICEHLPLPHQASDEARSVTGKLTLSASALETYARCPFRYFLTAVLGLVPEDETEEVVTLPPRVRGILVHDILHEFFLQLQREHRLPIQSHDRDAILQVLTTVTKQRGAIFAQTHVTGLPLLWEFEQARLAGQLSCLVQWEYENGDAFIPRIFEASFGMKESSSTARFFPATPVEFSADGTETLFLRGRIDRIDLSPDGQRARIVDYKSGRPIRGRFAGGIALQLPLYLFAARCLRPEVQWDSAIYLSVAQAVRKEKLPTFAAETWAEDLLTLRTIVSTLTRGIRAGDFPMTPDVCRPCPFSAICGSHAQTLALRKREDERVAFLANVRNIP
ncbi:MAG: PD-(D/E)XK nuclease family protein [Candidatus Binatia bacterium]